MTAPRTMALACGFDETTRRVVSWNDETAEPWADVLERMGEEVQAGAVATLKRVGTYVGDLDLYRVTLEDEAGVISVTFYLVGPEAGPIERDPDTWHDSRVDKEGTS